MPVMECTKNGLSGHKWGEEGVCFTGSDSEDKAAAVGRAIHAQEKQTMSEPVIKTEDAARATLITTLLNTLTNLLPKGEGSTESVESGSKDDEEERRKARLINKEQTPILKTVDEDKRLVTGVVLENGITDAHGDIQYGDTVTETAYDFLANSRVIGKQHAEKAEAVIVESFIARSDMGFEGETVKKGAWVMTVKVLDDELWEEVKAGKFTGFSIGGMAEVEDLED